MTETLTEDQVRLVFRAILNREPESDADVRRYCKTSLTLESLIKQAISSREFSLKFKPHPDLVEHPAEYDHHNGFNFLTPRDLRVDADLPPRVLLVGSCFLDWWGSVIDEMDFGVQTDRLHIDMHPDIPPPHPWDQYRFQVGQVSLRSILTGSVYFRLLRDGYSDPGVAQEIFTATVAALETKVRNCCCWADKAPMFFLNFLSPMHGLNGRLFRQFDLRDYRYFIHELNRELERIVRDIPNAYILDADACAGVMGRRFFQEDGVWMHSHGGLLNNGNLAVEAARIIKPLPINQHYELDQREFIATVFSEADAAIRTLRGIGTVKMVCVDLDDTLWRGVLAEADYIDPEDVTSGWPHGIMEALAVLKRRGIILCILSKNDPAVIDRIWTRVYGLFFPLTEFAIRKINWNSKADNLREAIAEANILPSSVVFLDDNPVERAAVAAAFPDVRVIQSSLFYWKRILMWSAETETAVITEESARRTEMVQAKIERDAARDLVSRETFLRDLDLRIIFTEIAARTDPRFPRVVELVNKTNQFNTTGRRWTAEEIDALCQNGIVLAVEVSDRFTNHGIVAVALYQAGVIEQVVMSCRVIGMEVELATLSTITSLALQSARTVTARTVDTTANLLSRDLFKRGGWRLTESQWATDKANPLPDHVCVQLGAAQMGAPGHPAMLHV